MTRARRTRAVRKLLPPWFAKRGRDLPWRRTRDPYAIWVSEIMLQQTRVSAVESYYRRFLRKFPDVGALARAPLDDVLKAWEGLGYYSRARNLHRAAGVVLERHGGQLPAAAPDLRKLPGVGRYTAGAIASIAFGRDEPIVDGNVIRVLARIFRIREDPKAPATQRKLWSLAAELLPPGRAGMFNQAMMELGALVCAPRGPDCDACPVAGACAARARGEQADLPRRTPKAPVPHYTVAAGVIRKPGWILIDRRKPEGLLGGLWEFPGGKVAGGETPAEAVVREVREELDIVVEVVAPLVRIRHAYTHFRITLHAFQCRHVSGRPRAVGCAAVKWVRPAQLGRYAFPKANHKILEAIREG